MGLLHVAYECDGSRCGFFTHRTQCGSVGLSEIIARREVANLRGEGHLGRRVALGDGAVEHLPHPVSSIFSRAGRAGFEGVWPTLIDGAPDGGFKGDVGEHAIDWDPVLGGYPLLELRALFAARDRRNILRGRRYVR